MAASDPVFRCQPTTEQANLLKILGDSKGYVACDGKNRAVAHALEDLKLAEWKGSSWGSQFWAITDAGRAALSQTEEGQQTKAHLPNVVVTKQEW